MKLRETLNKNTEVFIALVYEDSGEIIVRVYDNRNWLSDFCTFRFETIAKYETWKKEQAWVKQVKHVSDFKNVA